VPPNQELINRLMDEYRRQQDIIEAAKEARGIMKELNRLIAALGAAPPSLPVKGRGLPDKPKRGPFPSDEPPVVPMGDDGLFHCPECGKVYATPQGLGSHRRGAHGVVGRKQDNEARAAFIAEVEAAETAMVTEGLADLAKARRAEEVSE